MDSKKESAIDTFDEILEKSEKPRDIIQNMFDDAWFIHRYLFELYDTLIGSVSTDVLLQDLIHVLPKLTTDQQIKVLQLAQNNQRVKLEAYRDLYRIYEDYQK